MTYTYYQELLKPWWAPPAWLFGPVWTVLYIGIVLSFGSVLLLAIRKKIPWMATVPFIFNLGANLAFTPIQFGLRSNLLASADILLVLGTLIWGMQQIHRYKAWIAWAQIPYLLWVCFATVLQLTITFLNW